MLGLSRKPANQPSKDVALGRLKMVLVADRAEGSAQLLEIIKNDIIEVIRRHLDIDEQDLDIQICRQNNKSGESSESRLKADIPIRNLRKRK